MYGRAFEPTGATINEAVTGSAETLSLAGKVSDKDGAIHVYVSGSQTVFIRLDGVTPTVSNAMPCPPGAVQTFSMPTGQVDVKHIAAGAGSTLYVTPGRGV